MNKNDRMYGLDDKEVLACSEADVIRDIIESNVYTRGEGFDDVADRITWPIRVMEYKRRDVGGEATARAIAEIALDRALDDLDAEYAHPDGEPTDPTKAMIAAANAFGWAVVEGYVCWTCEPTGNVTVWTRDMARELDAHDHPPEAAKEAKP